MKKVIFKIFIISVLGGLLLSAAGCNDIMDQLSTTEVPSSKFWKTEEDATFALMGAYAHVRGLFDRDYYFEGHGDLVRLQDGSGQLSTSDGNITRGGAYRYGRYFPDPIWGYGSSFDNYYKYSYGGISRVNYVIGNVEKMLPNVTSEESKENLEAIIGEARLMRGMIYFRLISLWGDVPYIGRIIYDNDEVADIARSPIAQIKDSIMADFTYAYEKLPEKAEQSGRASKPAALAFRGKLQLFWASWNKNGWPELNTFTPNQEEATKGFTAAAADFKSVIDDYSLNLFRSGAPGDWGEMGKADVLPNYYHLFIPSTGNGNEDGEMLFYFTHGGPGTGQGDALVRDFAGRSIENSQNCVVPNYRLADRYQSTITGDFCEPMKPMNPDTDPTARTAPNSALNPESYANRDYRMKSTIMWDYEMAMGLKDKKETGWVVFIYKRAGSEVEVDGTKYPTYVMNWQGDGYVFRKFVRNYSGAGRDEGDMNYPVMRLADVFLMYAEADNEINGPQPDAIDLVNRVRARGNLPALSAAKTATKEDFLAAIEQERIVELVGEGQRPFDLRRWRTIEKVWGVTGPGFSGVYAIDTHGANRQGWYINPSARDLSRGYIFKIPQTERDKNPNLTQNTPWL
ncbi:MAG: RagB/SusD family nutrient uptake outer membrane protein [Candidatus Symbiothrix sp.]|jgi:hypothetical protein|nr:RagB/SusD family nutrient uptake outer membrane protein [Candidatus Symbiothrix sp.]